MALAALLAAGGLAGCGGEPKASEDEKANDVAILNTALGYEQATAAAYAGALGHLRGEDLALARELRGQSQEHMNAIIKAIRGLGGRTDPETPPPLEQPAPPAAAGGQAARTALIHAYEAVAASIREDMAATPKLVSPWPRTLIAMIAANAAQQLTLLREALGLSPLEAAPEPFENGETPPPGS